MQLILKLFLVTLFSFFFSCKNNEFNKLSQEESKIISVLYASVPKEIPPPPKPVGEIEIEDSIINQSKINVRKAITHKYAINENFVNIEVGDFDKQMKAYKANDLFKTVNLIDEEYVLIKHLNSLNYSKKLDKDVIKKLCKENIVFSKHQFLKNNTANSDLTGIISFSRVSFNESYDKAAVSVGIYRSGLDSNLKVYILEKTNKVWLIKSYKLISIS